LVTPSLAALARDLQGRLLPAQQAKPTGPARPAAVLIPCFAEAGAPHLLFTHRSTAVLEHRGEISFPGGAFEPRDTSLLKTALRETREEIGLTVAADAVVGALPPVSTMVSNYLVTPFVAVLGTIPPLQLNRREIDAVLHVPLAHLQDPINLREEQRQLGGSTRRLYFYHYGPHLIWGATGRILHELLELLSKPS
jgi:8-oxo-dGTP pyrophosphatase MutT (NUDIX family)